MGPQRSGLKSTYAEYRALPESSPCQLLDGDLVMRPAPTFRHSTIVMRLAVALYSHVEAHATGIVRCSPLDVILSDTDVLQPDGVFVSESRRGIIAPEGLRGAPDLCIEVLSERTRDADRGIKKLLYARHGVLEYWIVDPEAERLEVFQLQEDAGLPAAVLAAGDVLTTGLLPGLVIALRDVFAP